MKMAEQQQRSEHLDEPEPKRRKPDECESGADAVETKSITNIYYDCLERIFDFLDLEDLLMVAQTCKRLQIAAAAKFDDDFGTKLVKLYLYSNDDPSISIGPKSIKVMKFKFCLPFLRCFGAKISHLSANCCLHESKEKYLDQYVSQYCADTLTNVSFSYKSKSWNGTSEQPFKKVETVRIKGCYLSRELMSSLVNWFPNMRQLTLYMSYVENAASMDVHFPLLQHLKLLQLEDADDENAANILQSNRQLQSLKFHSYYEMELDTLLNKLLNKLHGNSTITKLKVFNHMMNDVSLNELERFVDEHPLLEDLCLVGFKLRADDAINFIRQMKSLNRIEFQVIGRVVCDRIRNAFKDEWKVTISMDHDDINYGDDVFYIVVDRQPIK